MVPILPIWHVLLIIISYDSSARIYQLKERVNAADVYNSERINSVQCTSFNQSNYLLPSRDVISCISTHASIVHLTSVPSSLQKHVLHPSPAGTVSPGVVHFVASCAKISIKV